jgi:hypothetical protein
MTFVQNYETLMQKEVGEMGCNLFEGSNPEAFWRDPRNSLWTV